MRRRGALFCASASDGVPPVVVVLLLVPTVSPLLGRMDPSSTQHDCRTVPASIAPQATPKGPLHTRHRHRALLAPPSLPITTVGAVQLRQVLHFRKAPRCTLSCHLLELLVGWLFVSPILTSPYTTSFCSSHANHQGSMGCPSPLPTRS